MVGSLINSHRLLDLNSVTKLFIEVVLLEFIQRADSIYIIEFTIQFIDV